MKQEVGLENVKHSTSKGVLGPVVRGRRRAISLDPSALVRFDAIGADATLPLVCRPATPGVQLAAWARENVERLQLKLLEHGAILFRGFGLTALDDVDACMTALSGGALEYRFRASPRTQVDQRFNIYTSTDYPAEEQIFPHNEHAYSPVFPLELYFFCAQPAERGGETPIGDTRRLSQVIDSELGERFKRRRIQYVRNYGDGLGLPWQTVFQTNDRAAVDAYCRSVGISTEWKPDGRLRTRQVGPAWIRHPTTGQPLWFNHATFFNAGTLPESMRANLLAEFGPEDLPQNTFYGDGSPIEPDVIEHLQQAYRSVMVEFPWEKGDLLWIDNVLTLHARNSFEGSRRIVAGMARAQSSAALAVDGEL